MTRKHFIEIARALRNTMPSVLTHPEQYRQWLDDVLELELVCRRINPRFDSDKFREACGCVDQTREEQHAVATGQSQSQS